MPAIYLFSKRTLLGGDDLQVPALMTIFTRFVQGLLLAAPQWYYLVQESWQWQPTGGSSHPLVDFLWTDPDQDDCRYAHWYPLLVATYLITVMVWLLGSIGLEFQLFRWSCHGTPTLDRQPRTQKVEQLLQIKLVGFTGVLAMLVMLDLTTLLVWREFRDCRDEYLYPEGMVMWIGSNAWWVANTLLLLSQFAEVLVAVAFLVRLLQIDRTRALADHPHELTEALWADRCKWMCQCLSISTCFLLGGQELSNGGSVYQPLSQALADYLETRGTLDVVPTDLVTGLLVLQRVQRQRILEARLHVVRSSQTQLHSMERLGDTRPGMELEAVDGDRRGMRLHRPISEMVPSNRSSSSSLTLRSRSGSTNDLGQFVESAATTTPATRRLKRRTPSSSPSPAGKHNKAPISAPSSTVDLSESARLVLTDMIAHSTQPIYRRLEHSHISLPPTPSPMYQSHSRVVLNPHNPTDCLRLEEGARMAKYALSIYTWMLYVYVHPVSGMPRLLCRSCHLCRKCPLHRPRSDSEESSTSSASRSSLLQEGIHGYGTLVGDNLCQWHKESLLLVANIPEVDLIYAQFRNGLSLVPYCILLDHQCQSVIVSARGSLSLDDLVTDVNLDPESLQDLAHEHGFEADDTQFCHAGVVASARNVYSDLERHGLLERLLQQDYPDYQLRLVGHSLGAGVATLLGYMLKARFPSLQVYNFSPPGCTMTWELATRCEAWATSFVLDSDIVPRLSVLTLERLRDEVLDLVGRLKVPKHEVLESFWTGQSRRACFFGASTNHAQQDLEDLNALIEDWLFFEEDEHHREEDEHYLDQPPPYQSTIYYRQLQEFRRIQEERRQSRGSTRSILLYPPGRMIHLLKTGEEGGCGHLSRKITTCCTTNSGFQYTPVYIANDDLDEIVVSPTMATDHFIDRMVDELSNLASDYGTLMDLGGEIV